jgi:DNA-binding CsgD family transcriptional regulator
MKHLLFFYLTFSYSIGFFSLTVLILAYLKSWWKVLKYIIYFLLTGTLQLVFLTYIEYRYANISIWFNSYYGVINYGLESLNIIIFPLLVNVLFNLTFRRRIYFIFGILFLTGLGCIVIPFLLGVLNDGTLIETLISYKIYRIVYIIAYLYSFLVFGIKIKNVSDVKERNFYIYSAVILLVLASQTIAPIIKTFPGNLFIFATGYFYLNVLLLKNIVNRFLRFSKHSLKETIDELVTSREKEILLLLAQGLANKDIGARLCISEPTVKSHIQNIYKKVGVSNRVQLLNSLKNYLD